MTPVSPKRPPTPSSGCYQGGADQAEDNGQQELLQLQHERLLLLREQQLLQREQQLNRELLLQQQQLQHHQAVQRPVQWLQPGEPPQMQLTAKQAPAQQLPVEHLQRNQSQPLQQKPCEPLHPMQQLESDQQLLQQHQQKSLQQQAAVQQRESEQLEQNKPQKVACEPNQSSRQQQCFQACTKSADALCDFVGVSTHPAACEAVSVSREESQQAPQVACITASRRPEVLQPCHEGLRLGSPLRKRRRKAKLPAVSFTVVDGADDAPIKRACFLSERRPVEPGDPPAASLLTASDGSLKVWDIRRMTTKWKYTISGIRDASPAGGPMAFWGLAAALGGSLIVAGTGASVQTFDIRGGFCECPFPCISHQHCCRFMI